MKRTKPGTCPNTVPMFVPQSGWKPPILSELPSWKDQFRVSIDTEFFDPDLRRLGLGSRRGVKVSGFSFAFDDGRKYYVPVRHPEGNVDLGQAMRYFRDEAKGFTGELVGANIPTELDILAYEPTGPIIFNPSIIRDVLVVDALIYEMSKDGYTLEAVGKRRVGEGKDETLLREAAVTYGADLKKKDWKKIIPHLPSQYVGPYGEEDAFLPLQVWAAQRRIIAAENLQESVDLESQLTPVLLKMRQRGVLIDFNHLDKVEAWARQEEKDALDKVYHISGHRIRPGDTMKLGACAPAFESLGIIIPLKWDDKAKKLKKSLDKEFLGSLTHPIGEIFLYARQMGKLYATFVASIRKHETNGRIHTTFNQIVGCNDRNEATGAAFGRLSSRAPNLQQQPARAKFANFWRAIYLPEPGMKWGCLDYSAQEPRWATHFAALLNFTGARDAAQAYCKDLTIDTHQFMADLTGIKRSDAKALALGLMYGEGGAKLSRSLHLPTRWCVRYRAANAVEYYDTKAQAMKARMAYDGEASYYEVAGEAGQEIIDRFNSKAPFLKELAKYAERRAKDTGQVRVIGGRVIHFPVKANGEYDWSYKALNRVIQGSAGMQVKMALIALAREMPDLWIQLQVHDEVDGSFESIAQMKKAARILSDCAGKTYVPFRIDIEHGPNWGSLEQVCGHETCEVSVNKKFVVNGVKETYHCEHHARLRTAA